MAILTKFKEVFLLETKKHRDERGSFSELFTNRSFEKAVGRKISFCQDNLTISKKGVLRGLHYQLPPFSQSKLVSVLHGKVLDVVVDLRKGSPNFGKYLSWELSAENGLQLFVPRGFAHGYITLSETSIFHYKVDCYFHPESDSGIAPDDNTLDIDWQLPQSEWIQSEKDQRHLPMSEAPLFNYKIDLYG